MVSIVVPVYNVEKYIRHCLDSLINQSYKDLEIILVDDGSTDHSGEICDEYAGKYDKMQVYHKENGGLSDARNYGMKHVTGEWLVFVDSDDVICYNFIGQLLMFAKTNDLDIAICNYIQISEKQIAELPGTEGSGKTKSWEGIEGTKELLYQKTFTTSAWGKMYKTVLFEGILFPVGKLHEDVGTIYKVFEKAKRVGYFDQKLYYYLQRSKSIIHSEFSAKKMDYIDQTKEIIKHFESNNVTLLPAAISRHFSACFQVILTCPKTSEWMTEYKILADEIEKYAPRVMRDKNARVKNRVIALIAAQNTGLAIALCKILYKHRS